MLEIAIGGGDADTINWLSDIVNECLLLLNVLHNVSIFENGRELLSCLESGYRFGIAFINISSAPIGNSLPALIREFDKDCIIVLIADSPEYAILGYLVHAFDYIVKPLEKRRIVKTIQDAVSKCKCCCKKGIPVRIKGIESFLKCSNIVYIESVKHYIKIHTTSNDQYQVYGKLDDYEMKLMECKSYLRCHQSYLVNMDYIKGISGRDFIMHSDSRIPIRKSAAARLKKEYYKYSMEINA